MAENPKPYDLFAGYDYTTTCHFDGNGNVVRTRELPVEPNNLMDFLFTGMFDIKQMREVEGVGCPRLNLFKCEDCPNRKGRSKHETDETLNHVDLTGEQLLAAARLDDAISDGLV